jgi:hypothetical protein
MNECGKAGQIFHMSFDISHWPFLESQFVSVRVTSWIAR